MPKNSNGFNITDDFKTINDGGEFSKALYEIYFLLELKKKKQINFQSISEKFRMKNLRYVLGVYGKPDSSQFSISQYLIFLEMHALKFEGHISC